MKPMLFFFLFSVALNAQSPAPGENSPEIPQVIHQYFEHLGRIFQTGSSTADIDALLALCHEDVRYIHRNYDADFDRSTWQQAFERNLKAGRYQNATSDCIRISNSIAGKNYYAIAYFNGQKAEGACQPEDDARFLILFKVKHGKIHLIEELW